MASTDLSVTTSVPQLRAQISAHVSIWPHPLCPLEPISCPAGWRFDALGHDSHNHGDGNYKWPHACGKWREGSLIKTRVLTRPPAGNGWWRGKGEGCLMAVRQACNRSCWKWPETPKDRQEATSHSLSWPVTNPHGSLGICCPCAQENKFINWVWECPPKEFNLRTFLLCLAYDYKSNRDCSQHASTAQPTPYALISHSRNSFV